VLKEFGFTKEHGLTFGWWHLNRGDLQWRACASTTSPKSTVSVWRMRNGERSVNLSTAHYKDADALRTRLNVDAVMNPVAEAQEDDAADPLAYAKGTLDPETVLREFGFTQAVNGHHWWERKGTLGLLMVCWEPDRVPPIILCKYKNEGGLSAYTGGEYMADATALRRSLLNNLHLTEAQELIHLLLDSDPDALDPRVELDRLAPARCPYCNSLNVEGPDKLSGYYDCLGCNSWFTQKMVDWETHARSQMQQEGLDDFDPSAEAKRLTTYTCPDCGSTNTSTPDGEGLCDCGACGVFFNPKHPDTIRSIKDRVAKRKLKEGVEGVDDPEAYVHDLPSRQAYLKQRVDNRTCTKPQAVEYACLCAEGVLHLFEQDHPQDDRPRKAIEAARRWLAEPTEANRQAADAAADAASAAAAYFAASADYASAAYFAAAASADAASAAAFAANATATYAAANAYDAANAAATYAEKAGGAALPESLDDEIKDLRAYAMQHGLPPRICTSYTKVTPESAADGDYSEQGWEDEDGETFVLDEFDREEGYTVADLAVKWLRDKGAWETSSSSFYPGGWYSTSGEDTDFRTGETTQYNFHLSGFTPEQEKEVWDKFHEDTGRPGR